MEIDLITYQGERFEGLGMNWRREDRKKEHLKKDQGYKIIEISSLLFTQ